MLPQETHTQDPAEFESKFPLLRRIADDFGGRVRIDEDQYQRSFDPYKCTISRRKAEKMFRRGLAVWREGFAVLTAKGMEKSDRVIFIADAA